MKRRLYTDEEIKILKKNIFIDDILYKRQIVYDPVFKLWSIFMKLEKPELTAKEIFERAGINTMILHPSLPRNRIKEWLYNYKKFGIEYFISVDEVYTITNSFKKKILNILLERMNNYD